MLEVCPDVPVPPRLTASLLALADRAPGGRPGPAVGQWLVVASLATTLFAVRALVPLPVGTTGGWDRALPAAFEALLTLGRTGRLVTEALSAGRQPLEWAALTASVGLVMLARRLAEMWGRFPRGEER